MTDCEDCKKLVALICYCRDHGWSVGGAPGIVADKGRFVAGKVFDSVRYVSTDDLATILPELKALDAAWRQRKNLDHIQRSKTYRHVEDSND